MNNKIQLYQKPMKNITTVIAESGAFRDLSIAPGTTARDIRETLGLDSRYLLTKGRGTEPFAEDENVYETIADGAKLYLSTPVEVGS